MLYFLLTGLHARSILSAMTNENGYKPARERLSDFVRVPLTVEEKKRLARMAKRRGYTGIATLARFFIRQGLACTQAAPDGK